MSLEILVILMLKRVWLFEVMISEAVAAKNVLLVEEAIVAARVEFEKKILGF